MKRRMKIVVAVTAISTATLGVAAVESAKAASGGGEPAPNCTTWHDGATFGVSCTDTTDYRAEAQCSNGEWIAGDSVIPPQMSYAYCSSVGSTYVVGTGWAHFLGGG